MSVSDKVKASLNLSGKKIYELAECFEISPQAMRNKLSRQSFSAADLIKLCDFIGANLVIDFGENQRVVFDSSDIQKGE
ncbi:hypothetical protein [Anaerovorax sp. IOR16]|uniref:hypothetical protein n=1 Tax=Anaerovorax sp. IOR16 TaxID=2773458 RepID=UPI0019D03DB6|nr:hypothetical protein [Anaerovorax sp. IOR16]